MNTTLTINLAGNAFYIDEDAYTTLKHYLENIEHNLGNDTDKKDVMHDIEARIAELFADMRRQRHVDVITLSMVKEVMAQLGRPDDFKEEPEGSTPVGEQKKGHHKKVYRDTQNKLIGGVCAGLGHWVGIDAIWVRLIFILCLLLWGITLPIYIVLWLIIPEAKSAAQRLDMRGEEPTVENIQKEVEEMKLRPENSGSGCLGTGLKIIVWLIAGFFLVIAATIFYALFAGAIALLPVGFIGIFFTHGSWVTALLAVLIVLVIGLPVFVLVYAIVKSIKPDGRLSPTVMWICLVLWLVAAAGSVGLGIYEIVTNEGIQEALIDPDGYEPWDEDDEALTPSALQLGAFHSVVVSGAGKITITQAEEQYVTTDAGKRKGFSAVVEDSTLTISMGKKGGKMWIQVPELKRYRCYGCIYSEYTRYSQLRTSRDNGIGCEQDRYEGGGYGCKCGCRRCEQGGVGGQHSQAKGKCHRCKQSGYAKYECQYSRCGGIGGKQDRGYCHRQSESRSIFNEQDRV